MSDQQPHAPSGALQLPRQTTPTWEIELLVSGATVFGLMQLPPFIDSATVFLINRVDADIGPLILPIWIYLQFTVWTLIGTFILHLALRGYWVALVGLHSVYPGGVRWEHFKRVGPYMLETSRAGNEDVPTRIEASDNRASLTFGVGFGLALVMLVPAALVLVSIVVALAARWIGGGLLGPMVGFWFVFGVGIGPFLLAVMLDQAFGNRWSPDSPGGRSLRAVLGFYTRVGFGRASNLPLALHVSNGGRAGAAKLVLLMMLPIAGLITLLLVTRVSDWEPSDQIGLPRFTSQQSDLVFPRYYISQGAREASLVPVPYIPDPVVRGPYLRLFVPYRTARHNEALREGRCAAGDVAELSQRDILDCFARLHDVRIDGQPVADLHFDASEDPVSGLRGMLAMIPMESLAPGRHELSVMPIVRSDSKGTAEPPKPHIIPFWR